MFTPIRVTNESRSTLFWAWDDRLERDELASQIKAFHEQHYAGFFMHSRDGLETAYLSKEWDEAIVFSAEEAEKLGMEAWLYDEDRFPSGTCGGKVSADERYALHGLTIEVSETFPDDEVRAVYIAKINGDDIISFRRIERIEDRADDETFLVVRFETSKGSVWFNGSAPADNLNPETVKRFISLTHEHYKRLLKENKAVPGIFTDEPSLADRHAAFSPKRSWMPWSYGMEEYYTAITGNDIYASFPLLFFSAQGSAKARYDYWRVIARRFEECYSKAIGEWCRKNGYIFTGHYLQEDKLGLQTRVSGSIMPHYLHEDIPAIDLLSERCDEYLTVKQAVSVAHQFGKKRVMAETFAACGWDFTLTGQKWITDWQYVLGVTNKVEHLALYSLRGSRKRDYPASFNTHSPFFAMQHAMEDYSARLSALLQQGEHVTKTLIIHPMTTVWARFGSSPYGNPIRRKERDLKENDDLGYRLSDLIKHLENSLVDPDLGDEEILSRYASPNGEELHVGKASYSTIVLPWMENIASSTLSLLSSFSGRIIVIGSYPNMVDGVKSDEPLKTLKGKAVLIEKEDEAVKLISSSPLLEIEGKEKANLLMQTRKDGDQYLFFIVNNDREKPFSGNVKSSIKGKLICYDPIKDEEKAIATHDMSWHLDIKEAGSRVFIIATGKAPVEATCKEEEKPNTTAITLPDSMPIRLNMPNVLTLDKASFHLDGNALEGGEELPIWIGEDIIRKKLGMFSVDTDEITQRYMWMNEKHPGDGHTVSLSFSFRSEIETENVKLAIETPEEFSVIFNGSKIKNASDGWYLDKAFKTLPLTKIEKGVNTLTISTSYHLSSALEAVYIIGDFAVTPERIIASPEGRLSMHSWTKQGLLHYPGIVTYVHPFKRPGKSVRLILPKSSASAMSVTINGHTIELPFSFQRDVDLSAYLKEENVLEINVYGSPRNMLGQLHKKGGKPVFSNPYSFVPRDEDYSPDYDTVDYGLLDSVVLEVTE